MECCRSAPIAAASFLPETRHSKAYQGWSDAFATSAADPSRTLGRSGLRPGREARRATCNYRLAWPFPISVRKMAFEFLRRLAHGPKLAPPPSEGFIYVAANSDGPLAEAREGKTISIPGRQPPWIVVSHDISKVIVAKWPGRLWRAKVVEAATPEDQASRGGPPRSSAGYTRAISVWVEEELPVGMLFGRAGEQILPIINVATNLTREQAVAFAAARSPEAAEAAGRVWKRWLEHVDAPELYQHGDFDRTLAVPAAADGSPVRSALTVVHNEVFQRAKALEGSDAMVKDGEDVWLIEPWSTAAAVLSEAALAQAPSDFVSAADFAVLTNGWNSASSA